jgi:hypothetical protein
MCAATLTGTELAFGQKHLQLLNDPQLLRTPGGITNVRVRYDPTVPAYVLRRRRSCGIFNPRSARLLRIIKYVAVPKSLGSCCKYLLFPLCHSRGREFESRRPRHSPSITYEAEIAIRQPQVGRQCMWPTLNNRVGRQNRFPRRGCI